MGSKDKEADSATGGADVPRPQEVVIRQLPAAALLGSAISADVRAQELMRKFFKGKVPTAPKELMAALNRSIVLKGAEKRAPGDYSSLPSLGLREAGEGLTAAQASLYSSASDAFNDAKRRLGTMKPLRSSADPENVEALRIVTLSEYSHLVEELGSVDGPVEERVDKLFEVLLDPQPPTAVVEVPLGMQGLLQQIEEEFFGLKAGVANPTINNEEENQIFTDYQIVKIRLIEQYQRWKKFKGTMGTDYGAQSGKLLRLLSLIEADVSDAEGAFDEISIEATDRESFQVTDKLTLGALFSWIRGFALEEGRLLVETGGLIGVRATIPTLTALEAVVPKVIEKVPTLGKPTVESALGALKQRITDTRTVAVAIAPPRTNP